MGWRCLLALFSTVVELFERAVVDVSSISCLHSLRSFLELSEVLEVGLLEYVDELRVVEEHYLEVVLALRLQGGGQLLPERVLLHGLAVDNHRRPARPARELGPQHHSRQNIEDQELQQRRAFISVGDRDSRNFIVMNSAAWCVLEIKLLFSLRRYPRSYYYANQVAIKCSWATGLLIWERM